MRYILLLLILLPSVLAVSTNLDENYSPRQTVLVQISGNFLEPILKENVEFKRNNVQVAFDYDLRKIGSDYFLYFILDNSPNNYTLVIKDILTTVEGQQQRIDYKENFSVSGSPVEYNLNPAFINTKEDFDIIIFSYSDEFLDINTPTGNISLRPGENRINVNIEDFEDGISFLNFGIYDFVLDKIPGTQVDKQRVRFYPVRINSVVLVGSTEVYPVRIINVYEQDLTDINLVYDTDYFEISPSTIDLLRANSSLDLNLTVKRKTDFSDTILLRAGDQEIQLPFSIKYTQNSSEVTRPSENVNPGYYCQELGGKSCPSPNVCSEELVESLDSNFCCTGTCSEPSATSYSWIGYLIGAVLLIVLVIIVARYIKTKGLIKKTS